MSYLVLARKHRPQRFADIIGQEHVVRTLTNAIALGRVHHAFLFTGARGVGKTTTARVLARALNCEKGPTADPCGTCVACTEIQSGASPDVLEIDGASNTGVDNVRELRENVRYLPSRGRTKLYIIDEVHMLSQAAFNALLKTLEEPPPHVKFIFATTEPHKIPVTILSRCQRFDFRRVSAQRLSQHLRAILDKENLSLSAEALSAIVREAQGSVRDSLSLLDQVLSYTGGEASVADVVTALGVVDRQTIFALCDAVLKRDATKVLELVAELDARGHDLGSLAAQLVEHFRDVMVVQVVAGQAPAHEGVLDRSPGEIEQLSAQAALVGRPQLHRIFAVAVQVAEDVSRSALSRVSLEMGLLRLLEIEPSQSLTSILARLDGFVGGAKPVSAKAPLGTAPAAPTAVSPMVHATPHAAVPPRVDSAAQSPPKAPPTAPARPTALAAPESPQGVPSGSVSGSSAAPAQASAQEASDFRGFVVRVRAQKPSLASFLEHAHVLAFSGDGVDLGFVSGSFYADQARDPEMRAILERLLVEHFGKPVKLNQRTVDAAAPQPAAGATLAQKRDDARREREREVREGALAHPMVQGALSILGGEVKEVIPLTAEGAMDDELTSS